MTTLYAEFPARLRRVAINNPARVAAAAYAILSLTGALVLMCPWSRDEGRLEPVGFIDALFLSTSAVSTTGLVTLDPGQTFSFFGEATLLILLQIGGVGYMTLMSFAYLFIQRHLSPAQEELTRAGFGINREYQVERFVLSVVAATLVIEAIGALLLATLFARAGVPDPVWAGIFHAVSAFCTAGFSLFATSLEAFKGQPEVLYTVAALSYLGAIGFVVISDVTESVWIPKRRISPTTRLILSVTFGLAVLGTLFLIFFEPAIKALPEGQQFDNAFFQAMTASTTVGFNSVPIGMLAPASILILYLLMFVGASPSGTGGGIKSTTAALIVATVIATAKGRQTVTSGGVKIPTARVLQALSTMVVGLAVIFLALILLDLTGSYAFDKAVFEVISALGTVGLSMGLTGELNEPGKVIVTAVMFIGRVGILAFFVAFALSLSKTEEARAPERDVML